MSSSVKGVTRLPDGRYSIRFTYKDLRSGKKVDVKRILRVGSVEEAVRERARLRREMKRQAPPFRRERTLGDFAVWWMQARVDELELSTARKYEQALTQHILPFLGALRVSDLRRSDIIEWRDRETSLSPVTINTHLSVLKVLINDACAELELPLNPVSRVRPLAEPVRTDDNCLRIEEWPRFLKQLEQLELKWHAFLLLLATTGMRFGEIAALRLGDVRDDHLIVSRASSSDGPKATKGRRVRTVPVHSRAMKLIRQYSAEERCSRAMDSDSLLFVNGRGRRLHNTAPAKPLKECLKAIGIERRITVHGLRHSFNDLARQGAGPEVLRAIMGHSSQAMTQHYSHVALAEKATAVERIFGPLLQPSAGDGEVPLSNVRALPIVRRWSKIIGPGMRPGARVLGPRPSPKPPRIPARQFWDADRQVAVWVPECLTA